MEIDEKNLSKHIANLMKMDILSNLTMKQVRAIALSMEHERLKAIKEHELTSLKITPEIKINHDYSIDELQDAVSKVLTSFLDSASVESAAINVDIKVQKKKKE